MDKTQNVRYVVLFFIDFSKQPSLTINAVVLLAQGALALWFVRSTSLPRL